MYKRISIITLVAVMVMLPFIVPFGRVAIAKGPPIGGTGGTTIRVTTLEDAIRPDGNCSLREAIRTANLNDWVDACELGSGHDTILVPQGTYILANRCQGADDDYCGDLDILDDVTLLGVGAGKTIIDGGQIDRVLEVHPGRVAEIYAATFTGGWVSYGSGGGILNGGSLTLKEVELRDNAAVGGLDTGGGGLANVAKETGATASLTDCRVSANAAYGGGGILNVAESPFIATVRLVRSTVDGNSAQYAGGGIWQPRGSGLYGGHASLTVDSSTVSRNTVGSKLPNAGNGGGIAVHGGTAALINSTVSRNRASGSGAEQVSGLGGGVYVANLDSAPSVSFLNATVAQNIASAGGPAVAAANLGESPAGLSVSFLNTIVAAGKPMPEGTGNCLILDWGTGEVSFKSQGHNLEDSDSCLFGQVSDLTSTDPRLSPLGDYGGGTQTHLLLYGSPAIDAGDDGSCPSKDQRGVARPQGRASDIGSVEVRFIQPHE